MLGFRGVLGFCGMLGFCGVLGLDKLLAALEERGSCCELKLRAGTAGGAIFRPQWHRGCANGALGDEQVGIRPPPH